MSTEHQTLSAATKSVSFVVDKNNEQVDVNMIDNQMQVVEALVSSSPPTTRGQTTCFQTGSPQKDDLEQCYRLVKNG